MTLASGKTFDENFINWTILEFEGFRGDEFHDYSYFGQEEEIEIPPEEVE